LHELTNHHFGVAHCQVKRNSSSQYFLAAIKFWLAH